MDRLIYYNDRIIDAADAGVPATIGGVLYGWGVFTTARIYDGTVFAPERHWERILRDAEKARVPVPLDLYKVKLALKELIEANSIKNGRARITILKGDAGGWRVKPGLESEILIFTSSRQSHPSRDVTLTISPHRLLSSSQLAGVKCTAMLENLLAFEEARARGFAEAVMLNERGEMVGATTSNLFWVEGDELFTPSLATGCVAGVTRNLVCRIVRRMRIHLVEGSFPVQRLLDANEVFLTSTSREIAPVASFDIKHYNRKQARVTRHVNREFQKLIRDAKINGR